MSATIYLVTDIQSGDYYYTAYEPEGFQREMFNIKELPLSECPKWAHERLEAELKELE